MLKTRHSISDSRIRRLAGLVLSAAALLLGTGATFGAGAGQLRHYPQVAYRGETTTFAFAGPSGTTVRLELDENAIAAGTLGPRGLELYPTLDAPGRLRVTVGEQSYTFAVLAPDTEAVLSERDGYLFSGRHPAILLPAHQHPPKHDRRWETLHFLGRLVQDYRPMITRLNVIGAVPPRPGELPHLQVVPRSDAVFDIHASVIARTNTPTADATLVVSSAADLRNSMPALELTMKLEWLLQSLPTGRAGMLFVTAPSTSTRDGTRYHSFLDRYELGVRSSRAAFLDVSDASSADAWWQALSRELARRIRWE